jgi:hypothetical protein
VLFRNMSRKLFFFVFGNFDILDFSFDIMDKMNNRLRGYIVLTIAMTFTTIWLIGNTKIRQHRAELDNAVGKFVFW